MAVKGEIGHGVDERGSPISDIEGGNASSQAVSAWYPFFGCEIPIVDMLGSGSIPRQ